MSRTESLVMELLRGRERYGLELVERSNGALKRGSVYVILARMEEKGFVESRQEERSPGAGGLPRRLYRATPYGRKVHGAFAVLRHALSLNPAEAE
jgi:DNA-binding PadR family transcriptional regulator